MKSAAHLDQDRLTLLYFDEAATPDREHLANCEVCRKKYSELALFLDTLRDVPVPEKDDAWGMQLWAKLEPAVSTAVSTPLRSKPARRFHSWAVKPWALKPWAFKEWVLGPALALLLILTFFVGRYTKSVPPVTASSARARDRVLLITLGDHLDRSQIVLAELINAPEGKPVNIAPEQQLAGSLVGENRLLRQTFDRKGDHADSAVLDELERVLLDIAHSPQEVSPGELDHLRRRIEAQGLLFKVRVISSNVREKGMKL